MTSFEVGNDRADLAFLTRAAAPGARLVLSPAARRRVEAARRVVDRYAEGDEPIYGLNTGLGGNLAFRISRAEIDAFQVQMVRGRCIGMGEPFGEAVSRLMFLCRILGLANGGAGITPAVLDAMIAMYNAGLTPVIPSRGSIGGGDLGLCAHMASAVIGLGEFFVGGVRRPSSEVLASIGMAPAVLGPKDGLGILNSSAPACGYGIAVLEDLAELILLSTVVAALSFEGYAGNIAIFDARLAAARPARGQERAAAMFRSILAGSYLSGPEGARKIQDALSFRVLSQITGPALDSLDAAAESIETEVNGAADNPLVMAGEDLILSTANFHTPAMALAFDTLAIVDTHLATASYYRITKLMNPQLSGLPKYLSSVGGISNGLNSLQKTASALHAEIRLKATPASLDSLPVSEGVEDHATHTHLAIRKLEEQVVAMRMLVAIEALTAAQAVDLRGLPALAPTTRFLFESIRAEVPVMVEDRETGRDAETVVAVLRDRTLPGALRSIAGLGGEGGCPIIE